MRGRVAAKDAVRLLLLDRCGLEVALESIAVIPNEQGRPLVVCDALQGSKDRVFVSIAHCGDASVALATAGSDLCRGIGIDIVWRADDHDGLAEGGFSSEEMALVDSWPELERIDWLPRLWCAKEAVGKALGVGLMGNPLSLLVRRVDRVRGRVDVEIDSRHAALLPPGKRGRMTAQVGCDRNMAFAVAKLE
jgi:phosphopantetheinyl transferase